MQSGYDERYENVWTYVLTWDYRIYQLDLTHPGLLLGELVHRPPQSISMGCCGPSNRECIYDFPLEIAKALRSDAANELNLSHLWQNAVQNFCSGIECSSNYSNYNDRRL